MHLLDLPVEVGVLILNYLDTRSKIAVYNSCASVRRFFSPQHVRRAAVTRDAAPAARQMRQRLFRDLGAHVRALDLAAAPNLDAAAVAPHLARFPNLHTLDVTFTEIYLSDLVEICPRYLKNISANFFKCSRKSRGDPAWERCQQLFRSRAFDDVHLIVFDFLDSDMPLLFLEGVPPVRKLKVTVADNYRDFRDVEEEDDPLEGECSAAGASAGAAAGAGSLCYVFRDCRVSHKRAGCLRGVAGLDYARFEYLFIMYLERIVVYVSPAFRHLFAACCSDLAVEVCHRLPLDFMLDGNILFKAWNRETTVFDDEFMKNLLLDMKDYFPTYVCMHSGIKMKVTNAPSDWYCIDACEGFERLLDDLPTKVTLTEFCRKDGCLELWPARPVRLGGSQRLRRLTFLRLSNVRVTDDFFSVLFAECPRLETLDVFAEKRGSLGLRQGYTAALAGAIHAANCLKNFKMTSEDIEYEVLFEALSRCPSLENVHVCEYERALGDCAVGVACVEALIVCCARLYSLFIEADMSPQSLTLLAGALRAAAQRGGRGLRLDVCDCYRGWNPCGDVFSPSPMHVLD